MPEDLSGQFADLLDLVDEQTDDGSRIDAVFRLGGRSVAVGAPPDVLAAVTAPFVAGADVEPAPDVTVHLVRRDAAFSRRVRTRWTWRRERYDDGRFDFRVDRAQGGISATDRARAVTVLIAADFDPRLWRRPETSRPLLERMLSAQGLVSVHGGTIGTPTRGVLVTAPGGRGKSSLVAAGVRAGWRTTGDDFLFLEQSDAGPLLHAMYRTVKIAPDSPAWHDAMAHGALSDGPDGKRMTMLDDIRPGCLVHAHQPVAIVVPKVGDRVVLAEIGHREALAALVPTSLAMSSDRPSAVRKLAAMTQALPCYELSLARDPERELAALAGLLGGAS